MKKITSCVQPSDLNTCFATSNLLRSVLFSTHEARRRLTLSPSLIECLIVQYVCFVYFFRCSLGITKMTSKDQLSEEELQGNTIIETFIMSHILDQMVICHFDIIMHSRFIIYFY